LIVKNPSFRLAAFAAAVALLGAARPAAPLRAQSLPPAADLVAAYVQAIGGAPAFLANASMHMVGEYSMAAMGLKGAVETFQMKPNRSVSRVTIDGFGEIRRGFDGTTGWSINPMEGPRLLEGEELQQLRDDSDPRTLVRDPALIASMQTVERTEMNGQACYRVRISWKSGRETSDCYAVDGGLLVGSTVNVVSPMGSIEAQIFYSDYRSFGELRMPTVTRQQVMGQEQAFTLTSVEFGNVDPAVFELPPEIRALRK
jgi:hypothetical protein